MEIASFITTKNEKGLNMKTEIEGRKYGKWTVLKFVSRDRYWNKTYLCRCECGREVEVRLNSLRGGTSTQCRVCGRRWNKFKEGDKLKFNTVLKPLGNCYYLVRCECGKEVKKHVRNLHHRCLACKHKHRSKPKRILFTIDNVDYTIQMCVEKLNLRYSRVYYLHQKGKLIELMK